MKKTPKKNRSSKSGKYVTEKFAKANPDTTQSEKKPAVTAKQLKNAAAFMAMSQYYFELAKKALGI